MPAGETAAASDAVGPRRWSSADVVAGGVFVAVGLAFAVGSLSYERGTLLQMGPAYVPFAVGLMLAVLGAAVVVKAFVSPDQVHDESVADAVAAGSTGPAERAAEATSAHEASPLQFAAIQRRPVLLVLAAVLFFAFTFEGLGLVVTAFGTAILASYARSGATLRQALITGVCLTAACWLIFVLALQQRLPLFGEWLGG